ncbi:C40 family peptidase [Krasilnikoviella flava]|uniref:Cell wall-associated hydrolase, NlpC family n=1 Tax=Krasilnikoviella flava TaxID=526729 RepID=A0A1T5II36_9MICO|nr:C40 family peptidase [Krasilnikoviella flava]SKC38769.1 Cell wall-associated hydrolase, NlpC family [Krasilnikoviella flava]
MNARTTRARHRAARRPLGGLVQSVSSTVTGRRAVVAAAAGGLLVSTFASAGAAQAAPVDTDSAKKLSTVDLGALSDQAREALEAAPVVTVEAGAKVDVETINKKIAAKAEITPAPEPEPEPEPEPVVEEASTTERSTTETASRSAERTEAPAEAETSSNSSLGQQAVSIAMRYVGTPYVVGGASPSGFDCSGLTSYVYGQLGIDLPRTSSDQRYAGRQISASELQPGDLIWSPGHIGIYAGDGMVVEASRPIGWETGYHKMWQSESDSVYLRVF